MSTTTNIGLFKHDNPATNTDEFNVDKALNQNWDKLDTAIGTDRERITILETDNTTNKQDITDIKAKNTEQDKYIVELEAENTRLKEDLNGLPKRQASGEILDLSGSAEMRCKLKISGNSKQETRSGKNLYNVNDMLKITKSTVDSEDYITTTLDNSSATSSSYANIYTNKSDELKVSTAYKIICEIKSITGTGNLQLYTLAGGDTSSTSQVNLNSAVLPFSSLKAGQILNYIIKTIDDFSSAKSMLRTLVFFNAGQSGSITFRISVLEDTTATTDNFVYEKHGAMPSPDYPSEVESCGDNVNIFDGEVEEGNIDTSTGQNAVAANAWRSKNYTNVKDTSVSISVKDLKFSGTVGRLYYYKNDNTYISNILINTLPFTTKLPSETAKVRFFILNSVTDINSKIKIENGIATPYSPYGQGCINEVICNKNLAKINTDNFELTNNTIKSKSTTVGGNILTHIKLKAGQTITSNLLLLSKPSKDTSFSVNMGSGDVANLSFSKFNEFNLNTKQSKIYTATEDIEFDVKIWGNANKDIFEFQYWIELDNTTEYVQHKSQTYTIPTQQPMRSVGDIRDTFIKKNNKRFERHYIYRQIFDGTGDWTQGGLGFWIPVVLEAKQIAESYNAVSSHFISAKGTTWLSGDESNRGKFSINNETTKMKFMPTDASINTVDLWKAWLAEQYEAGAPLYVDYVLKEPLDIECTEEQSTILDQIENEAKTYKNVTHIYSTDEISPVIDVTYKKDIETLIAGSGV